MSTKAVAVAEAAGAAKAAEAVPAAEAAGAAKAAEAAEAVPAAAAAAAAAAEEVAEETSLGTNPNDNSSEEDNGSRSNSPASGVSATIPGTIELRRPLIKPILKPDPKAGPKAGPKADPKADPEADPKAGPKAAEAIKKIVANKETSSATPTAKPVPKALARGAATAMTTIKVLRGRDLADDRVVISQLEAVEDDDTSTQYSTISTMSNATTASTESYIRDRYKKMQHREHIFNLPDTYIGSILPDQQHMWVINEGRMENKQITYIPGLYKIFDEVLVNAIDQHIRMHEFVSLTKEQLEKTPNTPSCIGAVKNIRVTINKDEISVENDGPGIDVTIHPDHNVYVPQLIFCELLTGTNYAADEKRIVGGKNGYGAKLCNIFSTEFVIETVDANQKKYYKQICRNNMTEINPPEIKPYANKPFTRITFRPDIGRFDLPEGLPDDAIKTMEKRVWDCAAYTKDCNVFLNGEKIMIKDFEKYAELFTGSKFEKKNRVYAKPNARWEVIACPSWDNDFVQVSLVNGISTHRGGKHVDHVANQICKDLAKLMNDKSSAKKKTDIKPAHVKKNLCLFIKCAIENPSFDTQTKECMTSLVKDFGSKCDINDDFIQALYKTTIKDKIMEFYTFKDKQQVAKTDGRKQSRVDVDKLDEGDKPGTKESSKCTLILTEGDSAMSLANSGRSSLGEKEKQYYGVFPLRGKLLNVREATMKQLVTNEEIKNIKKILGLQEGKTYETEAEVQHLRYGRVMIMTDADTDGDHIKGLIFNFFHHFWPSFMRRNASFCSLITPVVRIWKNMKRGQTTKPNPETYRNFYTIAQFDEFRKQNNGIPAGYEYKYYKGLATSTDAEAHDYFKEMKVVNYEWDDLPFHTEDSEINRNDYALNLAFQKDKADERKVWLSDFDPKIVHDYDVKKETYYDFIMKRLRVFSYGDNQRSIPSVCDGLKPSQRKVIYACLRKKLKKDLKVSQLGGYVSMTTAYHHGEQSLYGTIIGLAQDYIGSNNVNLLVPSGQFGNRNGGTGGMGSNSGSERYIFTRLSEVTTLIFNPDDSPLLKFLEDDDKPIEPVWYMPCLPMVLVNGALGIGTGYSTTIPSYNPEHIIENLKRLMKGEEPVKMRPWYKGYQGDIIVEGPTSFSSHGVYLVKDSNTVEIQEIPITSGSQTMSLFHYKEYIESIISGKINQTADGVEKKIPHPLTNKLIDAKYDLTNNTIKVLLKFAPNTLRELLQDKPEFEKQLKLVSTINTSNMHLMDPLGKIKKYETPEEILKEYYGLRIVFYEERRKNLIVDYEYTFNICSAKAQFIKDIHAGKIKLNDPKPDGSPGVKPRSKKDIVEQLVVLNYPLIKKKKANPWEASASDEDDSSIVETEVDKDTDKNTPEMSAKERLKGYDYLFTLKIDHLTDEQIHQLEKDRDIAYENLENLKKKVASDLWNDDLNKIQRMLKDIDMGWYEEMGLKPETHIPVTKAHIDIKCRPSPVKKTLNVVKRSPAVTSIDTAV
jgi:DNA topoisomerase II